MSYDFIQKRAEAGIYPLTINEWCLYFKYTYNPSEEVYLTAVRQHPYCLNMVNNQTIKIIYEAMFNRLHNSKDIISMIDQNVLPMQDWPVVWFNLIHNVDLRRKFLKLHGAKCFTTLHGLNLIDSNNQYLLFEFKLINDEAGVHKALYYRCPSSEDAYFTEVEKSTDSISEALKFLNNGVEKEQFVSES